jgi:hypothetical protein
MSEVINHARAADAWLKAGGREQIAARLRGGEQPAPVIESAAA